MRKIPSCCGLRQWRALCLLLVMALGCLAFVAGDDMLQHRGRLLRSYGLEGDIPCLDGGEEIAPVMAAMPLGAACERAEAWRSLFAASVVR